MNAGVGLSSRGVRWIRGSVGGSGGLGVSLVSHGPLSSRCVSGDAPAWLKAIPRSFLSYSWTL